MTQEEKKKYYDEVTTAWRFFLKYADMKLPDGLERDQQWTDCVDELEEFSKQSYFARKIGAAMMCAIEERARRAK